MDTNKNPILRVLLSPFSGLYHFITGTRNKSFDLRLLKSYSIPVPSIAIGNLSAGGTGKTPMIEFLLKELGTDKTAIVSRGYGRQSKGLLKVSPDGEAREFGDESLQLARKSPGPVFVSEQRELGVKAAIEEGAELILLDDAFQHRYVKAQRYILLSQYKDPFFSDYLIPSGGLREARAGAQRADYIIFTKCPADLTESEKELYRNRSACYSTAPVLFSYLEYASIQDQFGNAIDPNIPITLLTAIADDSAIRTYLNRHYDVNKVMCFKDHHNFQASDITPLMTESKAGKIQIVCTEKDQVKLLPILKEQPLFTLPVEHRFSPADQKLLLDDLRGLISS